jgi:prephenate dehydrogenase
VSGNVLGVLGVGAIGGSLGLRARANGAYVLGADCNRAALDEALRLGAIDEAVRSQDLPHAAGVIAIAAHLEPTLLELERLASTLMPSAALVIDVASVKVPVVRAARGLKNFVATHPMAGTERAGVRAARADLFEGCTWAYVPTADNELDRHARQLIESLGGVPLAIGAEAHDRAVALTSHLPQLVAVCYAALLRDGGPEAERLHGPVARELSRISGMGFDMWRDILLANAANIEPQLRRLIAELEKTADALARDSLQSLRGRFDSARPRSDAVTRT